MERSSQDLDESFSDSGVKLERRSGKLLVIAVRSVNMNLGSPIQEHSRTNSRCGFFRLGKRLVMDLIFSTLFARACRVKAGLPIGAPRKVTPRS